MKPSIPFERVALADAKRAHEGMPRVSREPDWSQRRVSRDNTEALAPAAEQWLDSLPASVRPDHLAERFPRIVNLLSQKWHDPVKCSVYLVDLMIVRRAARMGFPALVAGDIARLAEHYAQLHPKQRAWAATQ